MNFLIFKSRFGQSRSKLSPKIPPSPDSGFTLIELIVVIVIVGILAAIAAPGWIGFVNNRRVNGANDTILQAVNEAKNKARKEKRAYSVSFRSQNNIPQVAIHSADLDPNNLTTALEIDAMETNWKIGDLGNKLDVKPNQIVLQTNLENYNKTVTGSVNSFTTVTDSDPQLWGITFDHTGELQEIVGVPSTPETNLMIRVGIKNTNNNDPIESTLRCIEIETLLGSVRIGRNGNECQTVSD
jgi:prepilin-type N-terminal cleavage/methylation domain-containing protein